MSFISEFFEKYEYKNGSLVDKVSNQFNLVRMRKRKWLKMKISYKSFKNKMNDIFALLHYHLLSQMFIIVNDKFCFSGSP